MHSINLQAAITNVKDFEPTELEANHAQAINLVMNGSSELDSKLKQFTTITENKLLDTIFPFELEKPSTTLLFSGAALEEKLITAMYTDAKVDGHSIKLILDSESAGSIITKQLMNQLGHQVNYAVCTKIITTNGATKTSIGKIDDFSFEEKGRRTKNLPEIPTKPGKWMMIKMNLQSGSGKKLTKEKKKETIFTSSTYNPYTYTLSQPSNYCQPKLECVNCDKKLSLMGACCGDNEEYNALNDQNNKKSGTTNHVLHVKLSCLTKKYGITFLGKKGHMMRHAKTPIDNAWKKALRQLKEYPHDKHELWRIAYAKTEGTTTSKLLEIKNNSLFFPKPEYIQTFDVFGNIKDNPEKFHEHYQQLTPTREEQEQCLEEINTQLCDYCLIPCDFQYCNKCDLIYNPPPCMIYTIPEKDEPMSNCTSELESTFNPNSNSDNNDEKNTGSSSAQYDNENVNDSDSDSNPEIYIAFPDLSKEQELKWYSDNNESIMPKRVYNTDAGFDLRYLEKKAIKLKPNSCTCIDLKIALEIPATTMVQLVFRSSLAKKKINIRKRIINTGYVRNIIAMLQNNSEKAYTIEPNEKIAQAIFLPLVKVAKLVLVGNRKKLRITARGIQRFGFTNRIDISVNMAEEKIVDKGEIISTHQTISILPYDQYMLVIKREVRNQLQLFEAEATICELGEIGFTNLYISAKSPKNIKISIYNTTGKVIEIPKGTIIGYLTTKVKDQPPNHISNFP
ncbi:hypothetical protein G9A89_022796 [Geosiphon pyriformis]|nr:hypothetical protein G9A89_022796 [Geosiphon pyriformis]